MKNKFICPAGGVSQILLGLFCLCFALYEHGIMQAQPVNDRFVSRASILGTNATIGGSLTAATSEPGESIMAGIASGQSAWWTWSAPSNGVLTVSAAAPSFSPFLSIYTGSTLPSLS